MNTKISHSNFAKIDARLFAANGKSAGHAYTTVAELVALVEGIEDNLAALNISKKDRRGAVAYCTSGHKVPNSYKYRRNATCVTVMRGPSFWFLTDVSNTSIDNSGGSKKLRLSVAQDGIVVAAIRKQYYVAKDV